MLVGVLIGLWLGFTGMVAGTPFDEVWFVGSLFVALAAGVYTFIRVEGERQHGR
jgi:hypothetical protein